MIRTEETTRSGVAVATLKSFVYETGQMGRGGSRGFSLLLNDSHRKQGILLCHENRPV